MPLNNPQYQEALEVEVLDSSRYALIVWNDDVNTFDWVIKTLIEVCKHEPETGGYQWQEGATKVAESIVGDTTPKINVEHSLHVLEIIESARKSSAEGKKIYLTSSFRWPLF